MGAVAERDHAAARRAPSRVRPIRVAHVITTLSTGGAEMMLYRLVRSMDRQRFLNSVISLSGGGAAAEMIREAGVAVKTLDLRGRNGLRGLAGLVRELWSSRPDVVQTWMYHADLLGGLASLTVPRVPVVWNIRCGRLDRTFDRRSTIWISRLCAAASRMLPARILSCSQSACEVHAAAGYARPKMQVIPNGFDTVEFRPDAACRSALRKELGIAPGTLLIGLVARFDRAKDHATFFEAAARVGQQEPGVHFVLAGENVTRDNSVLAGWVDKAGIAGRCSLLGRRQDVARIMAALDIAVSSSVVEGFPNAVGEAMACGVPCAATDAGDSRRLVGETGVLVPVRNPEALAAGILQLIAAGPATRLALGALARRRIQEHFSIASVARQYEQVYEELARCAA
jgi:glycosyltransferase involved in cell wall biosynthesis